MSYAYTHALIHIYSKHITVTDIQQQVSAFIMNSYNKLIHLLVLIADLYLFRFFVGNILVLIADLSLFRSPLRHILVLIADLCLFKSPVGVT